MSSHTGSSGPWISHHHINPTVVQVDADNALLLEVERIADEWCLPYHHEDGDTLRFPDLRAAIRHVEWDARHLSYSEFAAAYPNFRPVTFRQVDDTIYVAERDGLLLAYVDADLATGRWRIVDSKREPHLSTTHPGWNFKEQVFDYIICNVPLLMAIAREGRGLDALPSDGTEIAHRTAGWQ